MLMVLNRSLFKSSLAVLPLVAISLFARGITEDGVGIKVLSVEDGSAAVRAGIAAGDVISTWARGRVSGAIPSPFEYDGIEIEQAPRGAVTLHGFHGGKPVSWTLNSAQWGIKAGVVWPDVQKVLDRLRDLSKAKQYDELAQYCRLNCDTVPAVSGARAYAFFKAADSLARQEHMKEAGEFYGKALAAIPNDKNYAVAFIYGQWARRYYEVNDWAAAARLNQKALEASKPSSLNAAWYLFMSALVKSNGGALPQAAALAERALALLNSQVPANQYTIQALNLLGNIANDSGDLDLSARRYQQALALQNKIRPKLPYAKLLYFNLGDVEQRRGDYEAAEKWYIKCLAEEGTLKDDALTANLMNNLGLIARDRGNLAKAEYCIKKSVVLREKIGVSAEKELASDLCNLAEVAMQQDDDEKAEALIRRALEIENRIVPNTADTAGTLESYGVLLRKKREFKTAEDMLNRALAIFESINPGSLDSTGTRYYLADLYAAEGDLPRAESEQLTVARSYANLGPRSVWYAQSLSALAGVEERLGKHELATGYYSTAISLFEKQGSSLDRADSIHSVSANPDVYGQFAALLLSQHQTVRAFEVIDRSRAQTLVRTLSGGHVNIRAGIPAALLAKDRKLEAGLSELSEERVKMLARRHSAQSLHDIDAKLAEASASHDLVEQQMRIASSGYASLTEPHLPDLARIQKALDPDTLLLEYYFGDANTYLFAVTQDRLTAYHLPEKAQLEKLAHALYSDWSKSDPSPGTAALSQQLGEFTLGPVADVLSRKHRLLIVADGALQYIPFAALPMPKGSSAYGQRLASQFEVVNLPSASLLVALNSRQTAPASRSNSIAIISDPVFSKDDPRVPGATSHGETLVAATRAADSTAMEDDDTMFAVLNDDGTAARGIQFTRLIHSREEADAIVSVSPKDHMLMALDFDANRSSVLDPKFTHSRILHIATHGIFDSKNPAMSGLVLSLVDRQGNPQAGFLSLEDIYRAHLSADLVVASACETALGEEIGGEGLVGLTWGFIYAGAKSVVASLWRVNDASTAELMRVFYSGIERHGETPAQALREAQLYISHQPQWSAPYYWAGFVLEGEYAK